MSPRFRSPSRKHNLQSLSRLAVMQDGTGHREIEFHMSTSLTIQPIKGFKALDGCHCVTSSFRKICAFNGYHISEEMLLGLGAGLGFIYWHPHGSLPFFGGRSNIDFNRELARRTGIEIVEHETSSPARAERELLRMLDAGQPVCLYADMAYLTYLGLPGDAHFGGHAIVIAGYDPTLKQVLISDIESNMTGTKTGRFHTLPLEQLALARASKYQPFPPKHHWFTFDFAQAQPPDRTALYDAVDQTTQVMLHPPIKNMGVAGICTAAARVRQWPAQFDEPTLRAALFNVYVYTEIGGTGGGLFRYMYSRFLNEAAERTDDPQLREASQRVLACAEQWRALALPLKAAFEIDDATSLLPDLSNRLEQVARQEEAAWQRLKR